MHTNFSKPTLADAPATQEKNLIPATEDWSYQQTPYSMPSSLCFQLEPLLFEFNKPHTHQIA